MSFCRGKGYFTAPGESSGVLIWTPTLNVSLVPRRCPFVEGHLSCIDNSQLTFESRTTCVTTQSLTQHLQAFQAMWIRVVLSSSKSVGLCTTTNWIAKSMSLEVLGGYDVTMREGLQLQVWNSYQEGPTTPALISRFIYKTTNMPGQTGRCSSELPTALGIWVQVTTDVWLLTFSWIWI